MAAKLSPAALLERQRKNAAIARGVKAANHAKALAAGEPTSTPEQDDARRVNAKKALAARAAAKAAEVFSGGPAAPKSSEKRRQRDPEFGQRLASAIAQSGKTMAQVNRALGLSSGYLAKIIRTGWHFKADRLALAAELLGVDADWLDGGAGKAAAVLVPVKKANGATHPATHHASDASKLDASMHVSADTAMQSVWGLLAVDVKLFLIARANELLAQRLRGR